MFRGKLAVSFLGGNPWLCTVAVVGEDAASFIMPMTHFFSLPDYTFEESHDAFGRWWRRWRVAYVMVGMVRSLFPKQLRNLILCV